MHFFARSIAPHPLLDFDWITGYTSQKVMAAAVFFISSLSSMSGHGCRNRVPSSQKILPKLLAATHFPSQALNIACDDVHPGPYFISTVFRL
jgi:hypothetical protein